MVLGAKNLVLGAKNKYFLKNNWFWEPKTEYFLRNIINPWNRKTNISAGIISPGSQKPNISFGIIGLGSQKQIFPEEKFILGAKNKYFLRDNWFNSKPQAWLQQRTVKNPQSLSLPLGKLLQGPLSKPNRTSDFEIFWGSWWGGAEVVGIKQPIESKNRRLSTELAGINLSLFGLLIGPCII